MGLKKFQTFQAKLDGAKELLRSLNQDIMDLQLTYNRFRANAHDLPAGEATQQRLAQAGLVFEALKGQRRELVEEINQLERELSEM